QLTAGQLGLGDNSSESSDSSTYRLARRNYSADVGSSRPFGAGASVSGAGTLYLNAGTTVFTGTSIANMAHAAGTATGSFTITGRSEERRVGKECSARRSPAPDATHHLNEPDGPAAVLHPP